MNAKLGLGVGVGAGAALVLAACITVGFTMRNRRKAGSSGKPGPDYPFVTAHPPAADPAGPPSSPRRETRDPIRTSRTWGRLKGFFTASPMPSDPPPSSVSTARDLLSASRGLFGPEWGGNITTGDGGASGGGAVSASRHSGKTDSAHTMHSRANPPITSLKAQEDAQELWTRGVDPGDVEIHRDNRGQPMVLGRGAFAVVYLGRWQATLVAVKVMLSADSEAAQREVRAEADILQSLRHPNIVLLMAICIAPNQQVFSACGSPLLVGLLAGGNRTYMRISVWTHMRR